MGIRSASGGRGRHRTAPLWSSGGGGGYSWRWRWSRCPHPGSASPVSSPSDWSPLGVLTSHWSTSGLLTTDWPASLVVSGSVPESGGKWAWRWKVTGASSRDNSDFQSEEFDTWQRVTRVFIRWRRRTSGSLINWLCCIEDGRRLKALDIRDKVRGPIRSQSLGHVITLGQSEASIQVTWSFSTNQRFKALNIREGGRTR